jgi:hypothetical protein
MRLYDFTGFEVITDTAAGDAFLMCTLYSCDFEENIEGKPLLVVMDAAYQHKMRSHL